MALSLLPNQMDSEGEAMSHIELETYHYPNRSTVDHGPAQPSRPLLDEAAGSARPAEKSEEAILEFDREQNSANEAHIRALDMLMKNAAILMANGESRLAVTLYRNVLMREPSHREALYQMGLCQREMGYFDEALKCFKALAKNTDDIESRTLLGDTYYLLEQDELALAVYREVLRNVVKDQNLLFSIYKNIGNIHTRAGDFESAEEFYNKAYTINQNSDALMINYGTLEIQRENLSEAVERFRKAVELNANNDRGWVGLAMVHRQMGDFELSWANIERALDINPNNRTALKLTVDWGLADGKFSAVIERLQDYIASQGGEDAEFCFILAKILVHMGRLREARLELERVLALDPEIEGAQALKAVLDREIARFEFSGSELA